MTRRGMIVGSIVGLIAAIACAILLPLTVKATFNNSTVGLIVGLFGLIAAGIAGGVILGTRRVHRYFRLAVPLFAAIAGLAFTSAASYWLISRQVSYGPAPTGLTSQVVTALIIGAVAYLIAAVVYGFAGTAQGVSVWSRIGLLLLLLLGVLPMLSIAGLIGLVVVAFARRPAVTTPARPAVSE